MLLSSDLLTLFFRRLISEVSGPIVTKLCHMFGGTVIYKIESEIWGSLPQKFVGPKTSKFRTSRFYREYLRTRTRYGRSENGVGNCNHSPTCRPNLVNFGPPTAKNRTGISIYSIDFFGSHISGAKRLCPEKFSQLVEHDQRLLMHTSMGMGLPPTIF